MIEREVFIAEITARAFIIADSNKRRTLSRADIAKALSKCDQFDFLIDVVPRDEPPGSGAPGSNAAGRAAKKGGAAQGNGGAVGSISVCDMSALTAPQSTQNREDSETATLGTDGDNEDVPGGVDLEQVRLLRRSIGMVLNGW